MLYDGFAKKQTSTETSTENSQHLGDSMEVSPVGLIIFLTHASFVSHKRNFSQKTHL